MIELHDIDGLMNRIAAVYGYDFTGYAKASLQRRVNSFYIKYGFHSVEAMQTKLLQNSAYFTHFVEELTVNVTEMFRDVNFYRTLREEILPILATYPFIRIWHAGCSTGEEVYSMAILLKEAGIYHKSLLYATDLNQAVIEKAKAGIFPVSSMQQNSANYIKSGGKADFSTYYRANYNGAKFDAALAKKMIFSTHNLAADASFNEFQLIMCRNVLIYFDRELQGRVLQLFDRSLESLGFLALGSKESLRFSGIRPHFIQVENKEKIWRKKR